MRSLARLVAGLVAGTGLTIGAGGAVPVSAGETDRHPIDHVLILMQENRSFDSYFGQLHLRVSPTLQPSRATPATRTR